MVPEAVTIPGLLGNGQRSSRALEVGLIRFAGITFPPKGAGVAVLPGQAPCAFTIPAQGSMIGVVIRENCPLRSWAVGTVAVKGSPVRSLKPSQLANQNVRFRPL